jgi:TPR repeat protein
MHTALATGRSAKASRQDQASGMVRADASRGDRLRWLPMILALAMLPVLLLDRVQQNAPLFATYVTVPALLLGWHALLALRARHRGLALAVERVPPVKQHFVQACVQCSLYAFWGWHWQQDGVRPIYQQLPLILSQFAFLYAFDGLLAWSRGRTWRLASGPVPIVLSTNLFIWFRDDWFAWQFAMVAAGLLGKEFVKWQRDGRRTHIFNPSGFGLAVAATVLIATGTTDLTWAKSLATTIEVPGIYLYLFALGMIVQWYFHVTLMTLAAAAVMVAINVGYTAATGVYLFASSNLPAAAFLGLHLLMTDPSTSPRTHVGRLLFGAGYGLGYIVVFEVLSRIGAPELYAKLYPVPILNCCVQMLDRLAKSGRLGRLNERWQSVLPPPRMNAIHMAVWASMFSVLIGTGYLYGVERVPHPGDSIPFWKRAVAEGRHDAARKLAMVAGSQAVVGQSGESYNELGLLSLAGTVDAAGEETRIKSAAAWFHRGMQRGSTAAAENILMLFLYRGRHRSDAELQQALQMVDAAAGSGGRAAQLMGLVFETGGGVRVDANAALQHYRRAGDDRFAWHGIARLVLTKSAAAELPPLVAALTAADDGESRYYLAFLHQLGRGVAADATRAHALLREAAERGFAPARDLVAQLPEGAPLPPFPALKRRQLTPPPVASAFAAAPSSRSR